MHEWMLEAKSIGHGLYDITRRKDSVTSVVTRLNRNFVNDTNYTKFVLSNIHDKNYDSLSKHILIIESKIMGMIISLSLKKIAVDAGGAVHSNVLTEAPDSSISAGSSRIRLNSPESSNTKGTTSRQDLSAIPNIFLDFDCNDKNEDDATHAVPILSHAMQYGWKQRFKVFYYF